MKSIVETKPWAVGALAALLGLFASGPLAAPALGLAPAQDEEEGAEGDEEEGKAEDEHSGWFAVVGGDVHTGTGAVLRRATVLAKEGKIREIGHGVRIPDGTQILDATGYRVYPGLVAVDVSSSIVKASGGAPDFEDEHAHESSIWHDGADRSAASWHLGLDGHVHPGEEDEHADEDRAGATQEEQEQERSSVADSYDPFSYRVTLTLSAGVTTVGSSGAAVKLKRDTIDGVVLREDYLDTFSFSSNNPSSKRSLREKLAAAAEYLRQYRSWEERVKKNKDLKEPSRKGIDSKVVDVLMGKTRAKFRANDRAELLEIARLAQQYGFRPVIEGCVEGWTVADELGRAGAAAIVTPRSRRDKDETLVRAGGSSIENVAILHRHGVQVAVIPANNSIDMGGETGRDLMHMPIEAGFAVRGGLDERAALESITIVPARLLGVDHRVGSLEVGKDCDLVVTDGDLLHYQTFVQWAVIEGKVVYDKQDELFFRHIRPRPEPPQEEAAEEEPEPAAEEAAEDEPEEEPDSEEDDSDEDESEDDETPEDETPEDETPEDETPDDETPDDETRGDGALGAHRTTRP